MNPQPAILIVDSREQLAYEFKRCESKYIDFEIRHEGLATGDYAAMLREDDSPQDILIAERKSHGDLLGSLTHGRQRFEAELERMRAYGFACIVAETDLPSIVRGTSRPGSKVNTRSVIASLVAFSERFGIHIIFASDRALAERYVWRLAERWCRDRIKAEVAA